MFVVKTVLLTYTVYRVQYTTQLQHVKAKDLNRSWPAVSTWFCPCVFFRDVLKWLLSAIIKSTEPGESIEAARERDEQIRLISLLFCYCLFSTLLQ